MRNKLKNSEERPASICNISSVLGSASTHNFTISTQTHTSWRPRPSREQIYVLFLYGGPPPPSLSLSQPSSEVGRQSRSQLTFPTIIGGHIMFCARALFHQRYQKSHVHSSAPLPDKGDTTAISSSSSLIGFASRPRWQFASDTEKGTTSHFPTTYFERKIGTAVIFTAGKLKISYAILLSAQKNHLFMNLHCKWKVAKI